MATVYNKKCLDCGSEHIHEFLDKCPMCNSSNLYQDLELKNAKNNRIKRDKGKSLIEFPNDYTIIDIETTGLMPLYDEIIELSALKIKNNNVVEEFSSLVKPFDEIDEFITDLTGITNAMLETAPEIEKILPNFIDFLENDIIVGYNVNFDINFIYDAYQGCFNRVFDNDFIDIMRICKKTCELPNHKLKTVANSLQISTEGHHRGIKDCYITFEVYNNQKNKILSDYGTAKDFYKANWASAHKRNIKPSVGLAPTVDVIDTTNFFYNKTCVFTGTLSMLRKEAMQLVVNKGGIASDTLTKQTNLLIVGTQDYTKTKEKGKSNKIIKAESYILQGQDLQIIPESEFCELINEE